MSMDLSKAAVETRLMLAELVGEVFGKSLIDKNVLIVGARIREFAGPVRYTDIERGPLGRIGIFPTQLVTALRKMQENRLVRLVKVNGNDRYELTDFGHRIIQHFYDIGIEVVTSNTKPERISEASWKRYREYFEDLFRRLQAAEIEAPTTAEADKKKLQLLSLVRI